MRYIIMCGGHYTMWEKPKHLTEVEGEPIVARTIRLLRENGITDIAISSNDPVFQEFGVPVLQHVDDYCARKYNDMDGYWCDCFYPTDEPTCYLMGDVVFSPEAIQTIISTGTDDIMLFGSKPPFAHIYPKPYVEPFAFKVWNTDHLKRACAKVKALDKRGAFKRKPLAWELWSIIRSKAPNKMDWHYTVINDYTCDIDTPDEAERVLKAIKKAKDISGSSL